ncbi:MAG: pyridoxal phosphate-dependent aminotransferase [Bacteroidetes bacterium GWC2_33_15]|nr:MAG: pyridoxal phosphate-dependent aminotransferase [Bacteroidetes bacterium GWA2_33_15]OFX52188.1 MAG: pyridoxal phosphate-dependent aminotransferase [Bacteroidetes bacterium GWC2_33_15]OFX64342.1 MAG: pyridoxal phosphate-dependent aminotransferase [Bacteroidetes bacterium GWB2_32_14]OFX67747.1 MAG: pyridoxal phosphate-dependent aminotransferase [Bacteroidetes bacterium GWD2_33_33]HAN19358.1 pyridoxal phosphate-dependent aminotransferase [Bacteroidales bacterium]
MNKKIWLSSPHMSGNELKYIHQAFDENWVAPLGPNVNGFENELQNYLHINHVAALSSGTAAIHLALILLGVEQGDEVLVSSFTFSATVNPIVYQKAIPVFIDSEKDTWNMDPGLLEKAINDRIKTGKKPKAIIVVHLYGMPAQIEKIIDIANKYEIPVIEDAAEALGSKYNGKACGTFSLMGILSFNGNKIITTSGGGALISNNDEYINKSRFLATQARDNAPHYQHSHIGYNYRMSNIVAGIGRGQLEVIDERVKQRRANHLFYKEIFKNIKGVTILDEPDNKFYSNFWLTTILIDPKVTNGISRETLRLAFESENIESRPLWKPMHLQPVFEKHPAYLSGCSEKLFENGLCLPSGSNLTNSDKERISKVLNNIF